MHNLTIASVEYINNKIKTSCLNTSTVHIYILKLTSPGPGGQLEGEHWVVHHVQEEHYRRRFLRV